MAWIHKNQAESEQKVRGIIVAREITEDLMLGCSLTSNIELFEYELSFFSELSSSLTKFR